MKKILSVLTLVALVGFMSCTSDSSDDSGQGQTDQFDREAMLVNWADNIIIPSYEAFDAEAKALKAAADAFVATPDANTLDDLRTTWESAYFSFQNVEMFDIGKAEEVRFSYRLNTYPTNAAEITSSIDSGCYDLELPSMIDAQGFPALDYLLFGLGDTDTEVLAFYTTDANAENYKTYLSDVTASMAELTATVLADWKNSFRGSFVSNTSSSASGSVDKLANDYIFYYEKLLRAGKVGIPAGIFSNEVLPEKVEAFYKEDLSKDLLLEALTATQNFFNGKAYNKSGSGASFKAYLDYLNTIKNGSDLSGLINGQFDAARAQANALNDSFVVQIETNNDALLETYNELQRNTILMKIDMLQALDINVDYVDADGD